MSALLQRLSEVDAALAELGVPDARIDEIRARIRQSPVRFETLDGVLAGLDIDLPAPAPPRPSAGPGAPSRTSLNADALFGDTGVGDGISPFDEVRISEPPEMPAAPDASGSNDLASLLEGDDDVLIVGGGGMALTFDDPPASPPAEETPIETLDVETNDVDLLEADDFELLVDDSSIVAPPEGEAAGTDGEGDDEEIDEATGEKKGFFRKLFS
jgi:hypothetical protein